APPAPPALSEPAPPPGHAAPVLELQPLATLTQGLAGQPQTPAKASAITPAQTLVHALNTALSDGRDPGPACEAAGGTANNAEAKAKAKAEGDADTEARTSAAQLTRYAWEQGWAEIAMLAHLIERITQRAPTPWPAALRTTCQHGTPPKSSACCNNWPKATPAAPKPRPCRLWNTPYSNCLRPSPYTKAQKHQNQKLQPLKIQQINKKTIKIL
ncbi:MAG TPA: hypothetical protein PLM12_00230, partial [Comamonas denitrificans]|nr:hypothetical protein [Comamonas denitrificans]